MKKLLSLLIIFSIILSNINVFGNYIYEEKQTKNLTDAIFYEERTILTKEGFIKAYVGYVDLQNPNISLKVLSSSNGVSTLETVKDMAIKNDTKLAINADFFNMTSGETNMLGMTYKNSELISTPALDNMVSFVLSEDNEIFMDYFSHSCEITSPQGYTCPVYQINKVPVSTGAITMLTSHWGKLNYNDYDALFVKDDVVIEISKKGEEKSQIPDGAYVLLTNGEINGFFDNFQIGDEVKIKTEILPNDIKIKEATGGNTLIVKDGKVATFTNNITGNSQRTAIGITKDKKQLILLTIDGRNKNIPGLNQTELAKFMMYLGAYDAINLDGGGSSTFVIKDEKGNFSVKNDVTYPRKVSTSIGILSNTKSDKKVKRGEIIPSEKIVLLGDFVSFNANFYDKYENLLNKDSDVEFFDEKGNKINGDFYPQKAGTYKIYAKYKNFKVSTEIKCIDTLFSIDILEDNINLKKGESKSLNVFGYSPIGEKVKVPLSLLDFDYDNDLCEITDDKITLKEDASFILSASFKDTKDYIVINKDDSLKRLPASVYSKDIFMGEFSNGKKVAVSSDIKLAPTLLNRIYAFKRLEKLSSYKSAFLTSSDYKLDEYENVKDAKNYTEEKIENTLFITLNTQNDYLSTNEFNSLYNAVNGDCKNIVITTKNPPSHLRDFDEGMLKKFLSIGKNNGKNIFYVYNGESKNVILEDNIRYISLAYVGDYNLENRVQNEKLCEYIEFSVSGNDIKYTFK